MRKIHRLDLTGQGFGKWIVLGRSHRNERGEVFWLCRCECGTKRTVRAGYLRSGRSTSCGCLHLAAVTTHGMTKTRTFKSWESMKQRCLNPKAPDYSRYGERGIKIHKPWISDFAKFLADMGERPEGTTLDRKEVNGNYEPGNCRWATASMQQRNKTSTSMIRFKGRSQSLADWAEETSIPAKIIRWRLNKGWQVAAALTKPKRPKKR